MSSEFTREDYEHAARAAGLEINEFMMEQRRASAPDVLGLWLSNGTTCWDPAEDDGVALRLAVKLGIHITNSQADAWATTEALTEIVPLGDDPYRATRHAIFRAAIEIGKSMKGTR